MARQPQTVGAFVTEHSLSMQTRPIPARTDDRSAWSADAKHYHLTLERPRPGVEPRLLAIEYTIGHPDHAPRLDSVLDCLRSDAGTIEEYPDPFDFAVSLGYFDSAETARQGIGTHAATVAEVRRLKAWLGPDAFAQLLDCEPV